MKLTAPKQQQGEIFEQLACLFLQAQGLQFVCKNWHYNRLGELDLVMLDVNKTLQNQADTLVIVEVRQRKQGQFGTAIDSISKTKQQKLIKTTQAFLQCYTQFESCDIRFDVVSFDVASVAKNFDVNGSLADWQNPPMPTWLKSAFIVGE